jgi:rhodanese-related sulfurtransferase
MDVQRITREELKRRMDAHEAITIVDARSEDAWNNSDVEMPGAIRVPPENVEKHLSDIPRDRMVVTYCT